MSVPMNETTTPTADEGFQSESFAAPAPEQPTQPFPTQQSDVEGIKAEPEKDDITRLLEDPKGPFALQSGTRIVIRQLKLREFLRLLRIITRGANASMSGMNLDFDNPDEFVQTFLVMILFAIPEAEEEAISFIQSMADPADLVGNPKVDAPKRQALMDELADPDMEDTVNIIAAVVASEGADLQALGKKIRTMFNTAKRMGVVPDLTGPAGS